MTESKIELTNRLKREDRWSTASLFKDEKIKELRATGMKRGEAQEAAWEAMSNEYPPAETPKEVYHLPSGLLEDFLRDATWAHKNEELGDADIGPAPSERAMQLLRWLQENAWSHYPEMAEDAAVVALKEAKGFEETDWLDFARYLRRLI